MRAKNKRGKIHQCDSCDYGAQVGNIQHDILFVTRIEINKIVLDISYRILEKFVKKDCMRY